MSEILPVMRRTASANCVAIASFLNPGAEDCLPVLAGFPNLGPMYLVRQALPKCKAALKALDDLLSNRAAMLLRRFL